jgi:hypothetical protein
LDSSIELDFYFYFSQGLLLAVANNFLCEEFYKGGFFLQSTDFILIPFAFPNLEIVLGKLTHPSWESSITKRSLH